MVCFFFFFFVLWINKNRFSIFSPTTSISALQSYIVIFSWSQRREWSDNFILPSSSYLWSGCEALITDALSAAVGFMSCGAVTNTVPLASFPSKEPKKQKDKEVSVYSGGFFICPHFGESEGQLVLCKLACVCPRVSLARGITKAPILCWWGGLSLSRQWFHFPALLTSPAGVLPVVPRLIACNLKHPGLQVKHTICTFAGVSQFVGDSSHMLSLALRWAFSSLQSSSASLAPGTTAALWWLLGRPGVRSEWMDVVF